MFNVLLKELRAKKGMTQAQLAKAIGVSPGNVGDWETGKSQARVYRSRYTFPHFRGIS